MNNGGSRYASANKGWGYSINYAEAVAEDEKRLASLTNPVAIAVSAEMSAEEMAWLHDGHRFDPVWFALSVPERTEVRRALLGLTREEMVSMITCLDGDYGPLATAWLGVCYPEAPGSYKRSDAAWKRLEDLDDHIFTADDRKRRLAKAKASLARHKRNGGL